MKLRPVFALLASAATSTAIVAGCGSDDSSGSKVAELAPAGVPIFAEAALQPASELKANTDAAAQKIAGVDDLGALIVEELESAAADEGEPVDFEGEVEPWLGEHGAAYWDSGDTDEANLIVETEDVDLTQEFIDHQVEQSKDAYESKSYEGVDYVFGGEDERAIGVVGDFLLATEGEARFKQAVDASESGESLAAEDTFAKAIGAASEGSLLDVYIDVGKLLEESDDRIDPQARQILRNAGIDPSEATAVAGVVPGSDQVTVEFSSDLAGQEAPTGDASELLGELPGNAFAAFAVSGFGDQVKQAIDALDEEGIPDTVPPGQLKKGLKQLGIDLEQLSGSLRDAGAFAVGGNEKSLGGALVLTTSGSQAVATVDNIVKLLRSVNVSGVSVLGGKYSGFSVRSDDLGDKPLVVAAKEGRIAIGYGTAPTLNGLLSGSGKAKTLSENAAYDDAVAALGDTPIGGFADGPAALRLADALIPKSDEGFEDAKKYLKSVRFLALGSATQDELATAKLIVGLK
ncbi:MAG TPA: DUF3352 domain-containing protein [Solirubrobacterales bacterium]|nr:DUF3352 domain-containing protein [Solirubrobacterales bacterium]